LKKVPASSLLIESIGQQVAGHRGDLSRLHMEAGAHPGGYYVQQVATTAGYQMQPDAYHRAEVHAAVEDPATKRLQMQQDQILILQDRKIKELEARAALIRQGGHSSNHNDATAAELQEAQARLSVLKLQTEQKASEIRKLQEDLVQTEQQLKAGKVGLHK
jgi:hypothetical protein